MVHVFELATNKVLPHVVGSLTTGIRRRAGAKLKQIHVQPHLGCSSYCIGCGWYARRYVKANLKKSRVRGAALCTDAVELCVMLMLLFAVEFS